MADILFIEDQPEVIRGIKRSLERRGHRVSVVGSGKSAIRALKEHRYDVIVLDIRLPKGVEQDIDLKELYQQVYGQEAVNLPDGHMESRMGMLILHAMVNVRIKTPVVLLSAYITEEVKEELESLEEKGLRIFAILDKPAKYSDVIEAIQSALAGKSMEIEETQA
jgi:CheY-like chemotaxis protein